MKITIEARKMLLFLLGFYPLALCAQNSIISGRVVSEEKGRIEFANVVLKGTSYGCITDAEGLYHIKAPAGKYTLAVSFIGFRTVEIPVVLIADDRVKQNVVLKSDISQLDEIVVTSTGVSRMQRSAYNAVAVDAKNMHNTTKNLSEAMSKAPGMKLRESGGVGSDMQMMMDGFSGKHVKVFIDGVPQEGVGASFGLNNIPVNFAERIEVYKGVVPVNFGTDAIGGVINIVTDKSKKQKNWFLDASYSFGSFNTHKSYVNFGQTLKNGITYEINAFQNFSDNNYRVDAPVKNFETGSFSESEKSRVKRFNDQYHNEAFVAKIGVVGKRWADRLMVGFTGSQMYKEIQTGVRQKTVYGDKHRRGYALMPSLEYSKRNLFTKGLDLAFTLNYNRGNTVNVDTSRYEYNWLGEKSLLNSAGEQSLQHLRVESNNWNGTLTLNYHFAKMHTITFNHVLNTFQRDNTSLLAEVEQTDAIGKHTYKNISGLSYRLMPSDKWNISLFGKYYNQQVTGPMATTATSTDYVRISRTVDSWGWGAASTYFVLPKLQAKLSYEKAFRLPTIEEIFGDEDLESGQISLLPENSDNVNLNISYSPSFGKHSLYIEGGLVHRNTKNYIQRNVQDLSGGKENAAYINYGKVLTNGFNFSLRYGFARWLSVGGNFTQMSVRDNEKTQIGTTGNAVENLAYKSRMPNVPYQFADWDVNFNWHNLFKKGNTLTATYDNQFTRQFSYYSQAIGKNSTYYVPNQFSHNISLSYSLCHGHYNISLECRNITNEDLYDNFSLQKAGRAIYGKVRIHFGR